MFANHRLTQLYHNHYTQCIIMSPGVSYCFLDACRKRLSRQKESRNLSNNVKRTNSSYIPPNVRTLSVRIDNHTTEGVASTRSHYLLLQKNSLQNVEDHKTFSPTSSMVFVNKEVSADDNF